MRRVLTIGPLEPSDRVAWQELFAGYNEFYERTMPDRGFILYVVPL